MSDKTAGEHSSSDLPLQSGVSLRSAQDDSETATGRQDMVEGKESIAAGHDHPLSHSIRDGKASVHHMAYEVSASTHRSTNSPFKQTLGTWILALVTVAVYTVTVCYAFGSTGLRYLSFASLNPSHALAVLRALSEMTALCLGLLVSLCTERMLWMLVARRNGTHFPTFLALHPSSGLWSWTQLILRNANKGRLLSWLRMVITFVIPVMGVIILSRVQTQMYFDSQTTFPVTAGIGNFDAIYASDYAAAVPIIMANECSYLLRNEDISWNTPLVSPSSIDCAIANSTSANNCGNGYYLHGGTSLVTPWPTEEKSIPSAAIYTLHSVSGLQLDFTKVASEPVFNTDEDCIVLGDKDAAFQICLTQHTQNAIDAKFVTCPIGLIGSCIEDTSWSSYPGWVTRMTTYKRHGTVQFSRANMSAVAVADLSTPIEYAVSASTMLSLYNNTLTGKATGLGSTYGAAQQFVSYVSTFLLYSETSTSMANQARHQSENLLAMPLYYFQPTYMSPFATSSPDKILDTLPKDQGLYTTASLSTSYYGLSVAPWTVWLYTAGMGVVILCCLVILTLSGLHKTAAGIPDTTAWSFIDFAAECHVDERSVSIDEQSYPTVSNQASLKKLKATEGFKGRTKAMEQMHVKLFYSGS